ncbi:MAG: hypothetical protein OEL53_09720 [Rhodospirillales bacterium]|nr:hypothetical protein [Rhodospirillales bacterium]
MMAPAMVFSVQDFHFAFQGIKSPNMQSIAKHVPTLMYPSADADISKNEWILFKPATTDKKGCKGRILDCV